jgi:hypothetical protein
MIYEYGGGRPKSTNLLTNMHIYADKYTDIHALNVLLLLRMKMARAFSMQGRRRPRRRQDDGHSGRPAVLDESVRLA